MLENRLMLLSFIAGKTVVCIGLSITNILGAGALGGISFNSKAISHQFIFYFIFLGGGVGGGGGVESILNVLTN